MTPLRRLSVLLAVGALTATACSDAPTPVAPDLDPQFARGAQPAVDVIVVLDESFAPSGHAANQAAAAAIARSLGAVPTHAYGTALFGFSGTVPEGRLAALDRDPRVAYWERDQIASIPFPRTSAPPWCSDPANADHPACSGDDGGGTPSGQVTPWGVTRVGGASGASRTAWVIDTGVDLDHPDLNVDVARSANFASGKDSPDDGNGHGTHVAGTIGAINNAIDVVGVAAGATIVSVRVLGASGSGSYAGVIAGVDYVAANAGNGDVANMSLGGPPSTALDNAVKTAASGGVRFAIAAGNSGDDAGDYSPARANGTNIYTVSAIAQTDCLTSWSNWGNPPVDVAAPGSGILSLKRGGGTTTMSGTSMAAPHMAGLLASGWNGGKDGNACSDPDGTADPIAHR
ncbi:MAG TPA: S8 family serine peptidase [Longimicrobiales bacterium]|nr:S8 family serine peptidase [Longimicrobiales bacterium]